ncbi:diacylglycerol/lipid kinase family protein [Dictyobacter arantiisoli]|uniref:Diacylglycerol kinase n=1 Tax=Dictyobacter arantiisoli TaxID=2014874 RepID=A0A5A5TAX6_9CHLR|nr:diacylglycerol kinase family protein [Dictyobacter arantiisoli]GCF08163.1 diacylglycerol kinase [Dictyobacter arantiisoli]
MQTVLILNPTSGESALATHHEAPETNEERILAALRAHQIEPTVLYTTVEDPGKEMAHQAALDGAEMVIAAGGDGTLHAVANGLLNTKCALGIIPIGTMNNIACSLAIPDDIEKACEIIVRGTTSRIDVGSINGHIFLEVAGIGLEAALFPAAEEFKSKGMHSTLHGIVQGLRTLITFQPTNFTITFDGKKRRRVRAIQISVCNSPYYGAHFRFAPNAVMDDGLLDVLIYRKFSKFDYMLHALSISQGRRDLAPRISRRKIKTIQIEAEPPVEIHADGEQKGTTPATISIQPGVLQVRVPQNTAKGPNMSSPTHKKRAIFQGAVENEQNQEKGPAYV